MAADSHVEITTNCLHCGQGLKPNQVDFCCHGCQMVHKVLNERGLDRFYALKGEQVTDPVRDIESKFEYLDTDSFIEKWVKTDDDGTQRVTFYLKGIQCTACIWLIEKVLTQHPGIVDFQLSMANGRLNLVYRHPFDIKKIALELASLGYEMGLQVSHEEADLRRKRKEIIRLGVAGALAGNLMMFSLPLYTGGHQSPQGQMFSWINFGLSLPVLWFAARPFLVRAFHSARRGLFHLDIPITLGLLGGECLSLYNLLVGQYDHVYFDSIGMLVFFLLSGRFIQARAVDRAMDQCKKLMADMPELSEVFRDGQWQRIVAEDLVSGDLIRLQPGESLAVDGKVCSDRSVWNMQVISGESLPRRLQRGDNVLAGSINMGGVTEVQAVSDVQGGSLAHLEHQADQAQKYQTDHKNSRLAAGFTLTTLAVAFFGAANSWDQGPIEAAKVALTVFIVACPCALALARPTAEAFGVLKASQWGLWIKKPDFFPKMDRIDHVVFDKTGVLTLGRLTLAARKNAYQDLNWLEAAVARLESYSDHPVARVLCREFGHRLDPANQLPVNDVEIIPGRGIQGFIDGKKLWIGAWRADQHGPLDLEGIDSGFSLSQNIVVVLVDGELGMVLAFDDQLRPHTPQVLNELGARELHLSICSGDRQGAVDCLVQNFPDIHGKGQMLPQDKLASVKALAEQGEVMMIGDGMNDMGALAAADLGVAAGHAAPVALRYADAVLQSENILILDRMFDLANSVKKAIILAIAASLGYNATSFYLAVTGAIGPLLAAVLMPLSSLSVIGIAAYIIRRKSLKWES